MKDYFAKLLFAAAFVLALLSAAIITASPAHAAPETPVACAAVMDNAVILYHKLAAALPQGVEAVAAVGEELRAAGLAGMPQAELLALAQTGGAAIEFFFQEGQMPALPQFVEVAAKLCHVNAASSI